MSRTTYVVLLFHQTMEIVNKKRLVLCDNHKKQKSQNLTYQDNSHFKNASKHYLLILSNQK